MTVLANGGVRAHDKDRPVSGCHFTNQSSQLPAVLTGHTKKGLDHNDCSAASESADREPDGHPLRGRQGVRSNPQQSIWYFDGPERRDRLDLVEHPATKFDQYSRVRDG